MWGLPAGGARSTRPSALHGLRHTVDTRPHMMGRGSIPEESRISRRISLLVIMTFTSATYNPTPPVVSISGISKPLKFPLRSSEYSIYSDLSRPASLSGLLSDALAATSGHAPRTPQKPQSFKKFTSSYPPIHGPHYITSERSTSNTPTSMTPGHQQGPKEYRFHPPLPPACGSIHQLLLMYY